MLRSLSETATISTVLFVCCILFFTGCSVIGYTSGYLLDSVTADEQMVEKLDDYYPNEDIVIEWKNGERNYGIITEDKASSSLQVVYNTKEYKIKTPLEKLLKSESVLRINKIEKESSGRTFGTIVGIIVDVGVLLYLMATASVLGTV